jgi:uncharacterized protein
MMFVKPTESSCVKAYRPSAVALLLALVVVAGVGAGVVSPASAQTKPAPAAVVPAGKPQALPMIDLAAGMHRIRAQLADSPDERAVGLMYRAEMPANEGMLFVFEQPQRQCFWMKNTLLPLSIAFINDDGSILNIDEMKANTTDNHCSKGPVRYVLEMNAGWFAKKGMKAGDRITGGPFKQK